MGFKRYKATQDTTITDAYRQNLITRGTGSNMGLSDILEVFSIYGQTTSESIEKTRFMVQFNTSSLSTDRAAGTIPASGSVTWYLRLFNAPHAENLPKNFDVAVKAVSSSWTEGNGLDMEEYRDIGAANWTSASLNTLWAAAGGDYHASPSYTYTFSNGDEDLVLDVSDVVEQWLDGTKANDGFGIMMDTSYEDGSRSGSFYTKKFFARGSEFFYKVPLLEARWNLAKLDDRGAFYASSSIAPSADNENTIYLYNKIRGSLKDLPGVATGLINVNLYDNIGDTGSINAANVSGGWAATGIYSASFELATTASTIYDVWSSGGIEYFTGSIGVTNFTGSEDRAKTDYVVGLSNAKAKYSRDENPRLRLFIREKEWTPNSYTVFQSTPTSEIIPSLFYRISRTIDDYEIVPFGTGSLEYTKMSYDEKGNYFDLDMSIFEAGYMYALQFIHLDESNYLILDEEYKFRVEE